MKKEKMIGMFEIFILILGSFSFSYFVGSSNSKSFEVREESEFVEFVRGKVLEWLSKGLASAQQGNSWTCLENNDGSFCQEYSQGECNQNCKSNCFPGRREEFSECRIGTCYDSNNGICSSGSPKILCENSGGDWFLERPSQCNLNCCLINPDGQGGGDQARYVTEQQCSYLGGLLGTETEWAVTGNELECLQKARSQESGACVLDFDEEEQGFNCRFMTRTNCLNIGGEFNGGKLCTNPELNTVCEISQETRCVEGKDEVYFLDSCGNTGNIYDASKLNNVDYWSEIVAKEESCSLEFGNDLLGRQAQCGNCEYVSGSICGEPRNGIDERPVYGDFVCKDLSCIDEWGNVRGQGESWCSFDSRIGVDNEGEENIQRSVDLPGSRHYRRLCFDGEVRTEPCADGRQEICQEGEDNQGRSSAVCRENFWRQCIEANVDEESLNECGNLADCTLQKVNLDRFEFDVCVPKYPPGFDLREAREGNEETEDLCSIGGPRDINEIKCTKVETKTITGRWKCIANCECTNDIFAEVSNNLCMSLGDCGANINLEGEFSDEGYEINKRNIKLREEYVEGLQIYKDKIIGQKTDFLTEQELRAKFPRGLSSSKGKEPIPTHTIIAKIFSALVWIINGFLRLYGVGEVRRTKVKFQCLPWQPPSGGQDCGKCDDYELGCSEYKCESLGQTCEFINEGTSDETCTNVNPNDVVAPEIRANREIIGEGFEYVNEEINEKVEIKSSEGDGCIKEYTQIDFGLVLDEPGQCKIDDGRISYEEMEKFIGGSNNYRKEHSDFLTVPLLDTLGVSGVDPGRRGDKTWFVRCQDIRGNVNEREYAINICVKPANDLTPARINKYVPENPGYASLDARNFTLQFFTNEPTDCKWSLEDKGYGEMENSAICDNEIEEGGINGWTCSSVLPIGQENRDYYIKCLDQPWLSVNDTNRNLNTESFVYSVQKTMEELSVEVTKPTEELIISGSEPVRVELELQINGGINGEAVCGFRFGEGAGYLEFFETGERVHRQILSSMLEGNYNLEFQCRDIAGNIGIGEKSFRIEVDDSGPLVTRVYRNGENLNVATNEESVCKYDLNSCSFSFEEGREMQGSGNVHSVGFEQGIRYYIKCGDVFGNVGECLSVRSGY